MKKLFLMLISATMFMNVANANSSETSKLKKVANSDNQSEILMHYASNYEEVIYIDSFDELSLVSKEAGITESLQYVRFFKSLDEEADHVLAVGVTEAGSVYEFEMYVCDTDEIECQCYDPTDEETYGTAIYVEGQCQCLGSCNPSNPN